MGRVTSEHPLCRHTRSVLGRGHDLDSKLDNALSDYMGRYRIKNQEARGRYYAIVERKAFFDQDETKLVCTRARSRTIDL